MSDASQGPGWWELDGKWYPPEKHPDYTPPGATTAPILEEALLPPPPHVLSSDEGKRRNASATAFAAVAVVIFLGGVAAVSVALLRSTAQHHTISGTLTVSDLGTTHYNGGCQLSVRNRDITGGSPVEVTNETGKIVGAGLLLAGIPADHTLGCKFAFSISGVPKASIYNIDVGRRGSVGYSYAQMTAQHWTVGLSINS